MCPTHIVLESRVSKQRRFRYNRETMEPIDLVYYALAIAIIVSIVFVTITSVLVIQILRSIKTLVEGIQQTAEIIPTTKQAMFVAIRESLKRLKSRVE